MLDWYHLFLAAIFRLMAESLNGMGVKAMFVSGECIDKNEKTDAFAVCGKGTVLVNCCLYTYGVDFPDVDCVAPFGAMISKVKYIQSIYRGTRVLPGVVRDGMTAEERVATIAASAKPYGLIIDHGANLIEHDGPPDIPRIWSLGRYGRRGSGAAENVGYRVCTNKGLVLSNDRYTWQDWRLAGWSDSQLVGHGHAVDNGIPCVTPYPSTERTCPVCSYMPKPISRSDPEHVDGDLVLLDDATLAELFRAKAEALATDAEYWDYLVSKRMPHAQAYSLAKHHRARVAQLGELGQAMGLWGGLWKERGDSDSQLQRRFYALFGIDVITAQALKRDDAEKLTGYLWAKLALDGIVKPA